MTIIRPAVIVAVKVTKIGTNNPIPKIGRKQTLPVTTVLNLEFNRIHFWYNLISLFVYMLWEKYFKDYFLKIFIIKINKLTIRG